MIVLTSSLVPFRTFFVNAGHRELRYRVSSAFELFDCCMKSRHRSQIKDIVQHVGRHTFRQLAVVKDASDLESLEEACVEAWNSYRRE